MTRFDAGPGAPAPAETPETLLPGERPLLKQGEVCNVASSFITIGNWYTFFEVVPADDPNFPSPTGTALRERGPARLLQAVVRHDRARNENIFIRGKFLVRIPLVDDEGDLVGFRFDERWIAASILGKIYATQPPQEFKSMSHAA